jgi:virginiamycin B lyase
MGEASMIRSLALGIVTLALTLTTTTAEPIVYFDVSKGAHPHDVAAAPDGTVWYTAQHQGALGILDPGSGKVVQIPLGEGSRPHGVIVGPDGAAWITDGGLNAIVRVDAKSKQIKIFPLPGEFAYANLNTAAFDKKGMYWFTGYSGIYGRVEPASGKVDIWKAPKGSGPYGMTATPAGEVWYASLAGDHIAKIDTITGKATVVEPPKSGVGPRRIWSDSKGILWVSFWNTGEVGRYDPSAGSWKVWALPNSRSGCYSVYVDEQDKIWLTDFTANAVVRFDPLTEKFESFRSNRKNANVRQMLGRPGEAWGAESGTDRLVVFRY